MATKKMRVWVERDPSGHVMLHSKKPRWSAVDDFWTSAGEREIKRHDFDVLRKLGIRYMPQGHTVSEYEVTAKLVKKIRPPKGKQ